MSDDQRASSLRVPLEGEAPAQDLASGDQGQPALGQAGETIVVERPAPGQTVEIQAASGQTYVLSFAPVEAQVQVQGDNFILAFDDNGDGTPDSQIVFLDLVTVVDAGDAPAFQIAGADIDAGVLLGQALALAGQDDVPPDDVAAGPGATGGGASTYSDNLGDIIDLLAAEDVIPPTELQFGLIELEDEIVLVAAGDAAPEVDPALIVGENVNDIGDETTPHHEQFPASDEDHGEIVGGDGGDVLIGDVGGASLVGKTLNLALVLDTSDSMEAEIPFGGDTMMRIEALDKAVEQLLDSLAGTEGATVRLHMVNFAANVKDVATFNIVVDGTVDGAVLQAAKNFILAEGQSPTNAANGYTNYEAGFDAALDWFSDDSQTLDDPDFNQTIFISDGLPNRAYEGDGTSSVIDPGSDEDALKHVLGTADGDTVSEYEGLHGPFRGVAGTVDAVGIKIGAGAENRLDKLDDGDADSIANGEQLSSVLTDLTQATALAAVGGDVIVGDGGDDLILGDAIFTDILAGEQALGSAPGAGWSAIDSLIGSGFFDNDPAKAVEEEIIDFLRDPANQAAYDFGRESVVDGVGREGGNDTIDGGAGNDLIFGQEGDDGIIGGTGDDSILGGSGDDVMGGGGGADLFSWTAASRDGEADTITDFETGPGGDVLDLASLLAGVPADPTAADLDAYLDFSFAGGNTTITVDFDGGGAGTDTAAITLQGVDLTGAGSDEDIISSLMTSGSLMAA